MSPIDGLRRVLERVLMHGPDGRARRRGRDRGRLPLCPPLRIEYYGIAPDTGGPGRHRGGLSLVRAYRILAEEAELNVRSDKRKHPPHGLFGGRPGAPSWNVVRGADGRERVLPVLLTRPEPVRRGDLFHHAMAGGGGYGDPLERDPDRVLWDVIEGKVSIPHAAEAYGVVVREGRPPTVDGAATTARRSAMRQAGDA